MTFSSERLVNSMAERVSKSDFVEKVLNFPGLALVDFYSDSCVPCKRMVPVITAVESDFPEGLFVAKVNIAFDSELVEEYGISSSPTFLLFKNGKEVERFSGVRKKEELEEIINTNI
ncbi:MAG: thioredoxin family protein [Oscillospiraceae bacterium]